ncbi:hypothetical protein RP20_CCG001490 [Aedes albopictus]|nr:hypothetical protein RP20_CCG001490 [Aedes albopictus]
MIFINVSSSIINQSKDTLDRALDTLDTTPMIIEINYDSPRGGVSVITEKGDITTSYLLIQRAKTSDSGKYTCSPSTANPITVNVHVLNGK